MNKKELSEALKLAKSNEDLRHEDLSPFDGCALPGAAPVHVTIRQVARELRYHCQYLNGDWDGEAINEMAHIGRRNFIII